MDTKWTLETSPNRPHNHSNTERKLDIFLYAADSEPSDEEDATSSGTGLITPARDEKQKKDMGKKEKQSDWKRVLVIVEIKCKKRLTDLRQKVALQLAGYAREVFHRQPDRHFVQLLDNQLDLTLLVVYALWRTRFQLGRPQH